MVFEHMRAMVCGLALVLLCRGVVLGAGAPNLRIDPTDFNIGTFFSGQEVRISGVVPANQDVIIEIKGPDKKEAFRMKGKIGPFWINRTKIELEHMPFMYGLLLPGDSKLVGRLPALGMGLKNIRKTITIRPPELDFDTIFDRFVQLKHAEQLYIESPEAIRYSPAGEGKKEFETRFNFPSSIVPGEYKIVGSLVSEGRLEGRFSRSFTVEEVGIIKTIRDLAYKKELLYGILCVIIALFAGMIIGFSFKVSRGH